MTILGTYLNTIKKTFNWKEKADRKEFWIFHFASFIIQLTFFLAITSQLPKQFTSNPELSQVIIVNILLISFLLFLLGNFFTTISVGIRRLNDLYKSKWWMILLIVPFIGLIFYFLYLGFAKSSKNTDNPPKTDDTFIEIK